jgi:hypothetical protein
MIGKIRKGKSFAGLTQYILQKEKAQLLCTNLAGETPQDYYRQLAATRQLNPRVLSPVSHISISFPPGEKPESEILQQIVEGTLKHMGLDNSLYFAATHSDRNHFHLHIASSRITQEGKCVSDWWDKRKLERTLRELEHQFNLTPVPCSWETDHRAPSTGQKRRMMRELSEWENEKRNTKPEQPIIDKIQDAIKEAIAQTQDFTNYVQKLEETGVKVGAKVTRTGIVDGLRYEMEGVKFQARALGHTQKPTLPGLQQQGINFTLERDAPVLARNAYSNKKKDERPASLLKKLILANPANKNLIIPSSLIQHLPIEPLGITDESNLKRASPNQINLVSKPNKQLELE